MVMKSTHFLSKLLRLNKNDFFYLEVNRYWIKQSNLGHVCCVMNKALLYQHDVPLISRQIHPFTHYMLVDQMSVWLWTSFMCRLWMSCGVCFNHVLLCICLDTSCFYSFFFCLAVELERRIDFELREGLVESRYWSAVTSHTSYWCSHDIALFLLTFIYKQKATPSNPADTPDPE